MITTSTPSSPIATISPLSFFLFPAYHPGPPFPPRPFAGETETEGPSTTCPSEAGLTQPCSASASEIIEFSGLTPPRY